MIGYSVSESIGLKVSDKTRISEPLNLFTIHIVMLFLSIESRKIGIWPSPMPMRLEQKGYSIPMTKRINL